MTVSRHKERESGAVLVFALLVLVSAAVILAGLAQMSATQALVGGREWEEARQRITLANSRALARGFLLSRIFWNDGVNGVPTNAFGFTNTNFGGFTILSNTLIDFWAAVNSTNLSTILGVNPFSPFERGGFYPATISATLWDGSQVINSDGSSNVNRNTPWNFQVRLRSPIAAGYTLVRHAPNAPTNKLSNSINTLYRPAMYFSYMDIPGVQASSVTNTTRDLSGYNGYLDTPVAAQLTPFAGGTLTNPVPSVPTNAIATVKLSEAVDKLYIYTPPMFYTNPNGVVAPVTELFLWGDSNPLSPPFLVSVDQANESLRRVTLVLNNSRPVYLHIRSNPAAPRSVFEISSSASFWRIGVSAQLIAAARNVQFSLPSATNFTISGGIRTDAGIINPPMFVADTNPAGLDFIADKMMWLEDGRARQ